ncbi:MAG: hypothetical protein JNM89_09445 [Hyphomicrobiaceae bacterium]|nr:hypothetical protein [Hyphomicrobiaceae bacterium]
MHAAVRLTGDDAALTAECGVPDRASRPPTAIVSGLDVLLAVIVAAAEAGLLLYVWRGHPLWPVLIGHVIVLAVIVALVYVTRHRRRDWTAPLLMLMAVATSGPVGAVISALAMTWLRRPSLPSALLADWYTRISLSTRTDEETRLAERVAAGRVIDTTHGAPSSFVGVMEGGPLDARQRALGLVARSFHPGYLPTLVAALASEEPVVRVQAAAVAAHVRPRLAPEADRLIALAQATPDVAQRLEAASDLDRLARSGLLDKEIEDRASRAVTRAIGEIDLFAIPVAVDASTAIDTYERMLAEHRMMSRLRALRLRRRLALNGLGRLRRRRLHQVGPPVSYAEVGAR